MSRADTLPQRFNSVTLLVAFLAMPLTGRQQPPTTSLSHTQIVLLGTGDPAADPDQSGPATAVIVNDTPYLVDLGAGVVRRAKAAVVDRGIKALEPTNLRVAFVTHLASTTRWDTKPDPHAVGARTAGPPRSLRTVGNQSDDRAPARSVPG